MNQRTTNLQRFLAEENVHTTISTIAGLNVLFFNGFTIVHSNENFVVEKVGIKSKKPIVTYIKTPGAVLKYLQELQ